MRIEPLDIQARQDLAVAADAAVGQAQPHRL